MVRATADRAGLEDTNGGSGVVILYRSRLFRDVIVRILRDARGVSIACATHRRGEALQVAGRQAVQSLIVETHGPVQQDRGLLRFLSGVTSMNPNLRIVALSLSEAGAFVYAWRRLDHIEADQLVAELCAR